MPIFPVVSATNGDRLGCIMICEPIIGDVRRVISARPFVTLDLSHLSELSSTNYAHLLTTQAFVYNGIDVGGA